MTVRLLQAGVRRGQDRRVPDVQWSAVCDVLTSEGMGDLPDARVEGCNVADWQAVFDMVRAGSWRWEYREGEGAAEVPPPADDLFSSPPRMGDALLRVWLTEDLQVILWFLEAGQVDFDVNITGLRDQRQLDALCAWFRSLGQQLGKPVIMSGEGSLTPVLTYDVVSDRVILDAPF